jgi:competence protein ComGC
VANVPTNKNHIKENLKKMFKNEKGFTLIEMLIVMMIISVLIILIVPNLSGRSKDVNEKGCEALVTVVQAQVEAYQLEKGKKAATLDDLVPAFISNEQKTCKNGDTLSLKDGVVTIPSK